MGVTESYLNTSRARVCLTIIALLAAAIGLASCNEGDSPTAPFPAAPSPTPAPSPASLGHVAGTVRDTSTGVNGYVGCLDGATIEIVSGSRAGTRHHQVCSDWEGYGYLFNDLPLEPVILRASKAGYVAQDQTITPIPGNAYFWYEHHFDFVLSPAIP